ncbi:hypothetical protein OC834_004295 [Tilletia horrida]|uniref:Major facilitator superfamily (MFS) profile domain-containing protein n=1 Tax=Tilletia horrida TaxID=155126 RepID=A0AAN6GC40_9BASI|nr:hypothetical protein OC834_004295 [Tilletia horrida]KAK0530610.1 hypothetical protein OC842_003882 [Tilletia horrida]KAK0531239.1 hypothetical protein OC835_003730 [Tilletia horrida]KAK0560267.1 hypothetical protein OC844_003862 [Tilletia horrida]
MRPHLTRVYAISAIAAISGLQYGLDTGSVGSVIEMQRFVEDIGELSEAKQGVFVASVLFSASFATLASGHLADAFSRKQSLKIGAALMCIGALMSSCAQNIATLYAARAVYGMGIGSTFAISTLYLCEIAPPSKRGVVGCMPQMFCASGVAIGFFLAFASSRLHSTLAWRLPFLVQTCTAALLFLGCFFIPYSPRWLAEHGRTDDARAVLTQLRESEAVAQLELDEVLKSKAERALLSQRVSFLDAFRPPYSRRTWLTLYLMASQQLSGVDFLLYYSPRLFAQAGFSGNQASFLASAVVGLICMVMTLFGQIFLDRMGRKLPLVFGALIMAACFFIIGGINAAGHTAAPGMKWVIMFSIYVFIAAFSVTWGCVLKVMVSEILPTHIRARTSSLSQFSNWTVNSMVALTAPSFLHASTSAPYMLYAGLTLVAGLVCAAMLPDTANLSLEEIDRRFDEDSKNVRVFGWASGRKVSGSAPNSAANTPAAVEGQAGFDWALRMRVRG